MLATSEWAKAIADEGGRDKMYKNKIKKRK
jgi:hypothetical protein